MPGATLPLRLLLTLLVCGACAAAQSAPEQITFTRAPSSAGLRVDQSTSVSLNLKTQLRKQAEVLEKRTSRVLRSRRRVLEPALVHHGVTTAAYVRYHKSETTHDDKPSRPDPIAGKAYYCQRVGEEVRVQTLDGHEPPADEIKLVAENMETLGRPNPLAIYLSDRTVSVGEKLTLPAEVGQKLLGLGGALGEVKRFELTLQRVVTHEGQPCGEFLADVEALRRDASQMRLMIGGRITIERDTCRAVASELSGPIGMSHSANDPRGRLQLDSTGRIDVRVSSRATTEGVARR